MKFFKSENQAIKETLYFGEHKSGLGVFVVPKPGFSKKYAIFGARIGSVDNTFIPNGGKEPITVPDGIAHFLEHKMFEQPDGTNAFDKFSQNGADANAFTSFTSTCYLFSCTANFENNLEHLLSYVQSPYFTDENVKKEQGIIGQEIRMYDDDGEWRVMFNLLTALYHNSAVKIDIAGTVESIANINKDTLYNCYRTFYDPSNMVLCVCGDVDPKTVGRIVDKVIRPERTGTQAVSIYPDEPETVAKPLVEQHLSVAMPLFQLGFKDKSGYAGEELLKHEIAARILLRTIAGKSGALYSALYKEGLINEAFSYDFMYEPQFSCVLMGGESKDPVLASEKIRAFIDQIEEITPEEFERAKKALRGGYLRAYNDVNAVADMLCRSLLKGVDAFTYLSVLDSVSPGFVNQKLHTLFQNDAACALSVVYPKEEGDA